MHTKQYDTYDTTTMTVTIYTRTTRTINRNNDSPRNGDVKRIRLEQIHCMSRNKNEEQMKIYE